MVYTLLSALPDQKKEMYGALHTYLKWDYTHVWDDLMVRGQDQEDRAPPEVQNDEEIRTTFGPNLVPKAPAIFFRAQSWSVTDTPCPRPGNSSRCPSMFTIYYKAAHNEIDTTKRILEGRLA